MSALIPYAGQEDAAEARRGFSEEAARRARWNFGMRAYLLFKEGKDTDAIASHLNISGARALKLVTEVRSRLQGKPNPYARSIL